MKIAIVAIGNEILNGSITDTNSGYIARALESAGYKINSIQAVSDNIKEISQNLKCLIGLYDVVITTGGLGPTFDDRTMEAVSYAADSRLKLNREIYADIMKKVKSKKIAVKLSHLRQAYLPDDCDILKNDYGTAPGILKNVKGTNIFCMPGIPSEMKPMLINYVLPKILSIYPVKKRYRYDLKFTGVPESDMDEYLKKVDTKGIEIILNAQEGELAVRVFSDDKTRLDLLCKSIYDKFSDNLYSKKDELIEDVVDDELCRKNMRLGIIEDFSGGYLSLLMSDKKSFAGAIVNKSTHKGLYHDIENADITVYPNSLEGSEFVVNIYYADKVNQIRTKYMGNINFMKKSASKRTLGLLYEFLKNLDFFEKGQ